MSDDSHEHTLIPSTERCVLGVGVDVGGSGVRAALCTPSSSGPTVLRGAEVVHGGGLAADVARAVRAVAERDGATRGTTLLLAVAAPGQKTADGRGIARARNVIAAPRLLDELAAELAPSDVPGRIRLTLAPTLHSDADAALAGERHASDGLARGARDVLLLVPGTGLGEAWLVDGHARACDATRAAALPAPPGDACADLEEACALATVTRRHGGRPGDVERAAAEGEPSARAELERLGRALAHLVALRLAAPPFQGRDVRVVVRTRAGSFFPHAAVRDIVVPTLRTTLARFDATLAVPSVPASPFAACLGALALALLPDPASPS